MACTAWKCPQCRKIFFRAKHLNDHLRVAGCITEELKKVRLPRNRLRTAQRHIGPFVLYCKDNLRRCRASKTGSVRFTLMEPNTGSEDVVNLARTVKKVIKTSLKKKIQITVEELRARTLATCLSAALFCTSRAVRRLGCINSSIPARVWCGAWFRGKWRRGAPT